MFKKLVKGMCLLTVFAFLAVPANVMSCDGSNSGKIIKLVKFGDTSNQSSSDFCLIAKGGKGNGGNGGNGPGNGTGNGGNGPKDGSGYGKKTGTCINN